MDRLLRNYMNRFFGYGSWNAPYWFIGIEEADCGEPITDRLERWRRRDCSDLEDFAQFHENTQHCRFIGKKPAYQRTWGSLVKIFLSFKGVDWDKATVLDFQGNTFARRNKEVAAIDLFPLPSRSVNHWSYRTQFANVPFLKSRELYEHTLFPRRQRVLNRRIQQYKPKLVVFYSKTYSDLAEGVAGVNLAQSSCADCLEGANAATFFFVCRLRRPSDESLRKIGLYLRGQTAINK
jgi:hypothetical protein